MKNLTKIFMAVVAGMFAFSCVTDTTEDLGVKVEGQGGVYEVAISLEGTKTQLGEKVDGLYSLYWSEGDAIAINGVSSLPLAADAAGLADATFNFTQAVERPFCVVYPAAAGVGEGTVFPVTFATNQPYTVGSFAPQAAPMYGYAAAIAEGEEEAPVQLNHLTGVLRLALKGNGEKVTSIRVQAEKGAIAGPFTVDCSNGTLTALEGASNTTTVTFAEGLVLGDEAQAVYVAVPAGNYGTFLITVYTEAHQKMTVKFESTIKAIAAGTVREFNEFVYQANTADTDSEEFLIESAEDLIAFAKIAGAFYPRTSAKVVAEIDMTGIEWTPIKNFGEYTFDGGNFAIKGLSAPLFGTTAGTIKNVKLTDINYTVTDLTHSGAIACYLYGSMDNCSAEGAININNTTHAPEKITNQYEEICHGGLVGMAHGATVTNCTNDVDITITSFTSPTVKIKSCVGGVVAGAGAAATFQHLTNNGDITYVGTTQGQNIYISGVVGKTNTQFGDVPIAAINDCTNNGALSSAKGSDCAGSLILSGITGNLQFETEDVLAKNLLNTGAITHAGECGSLTIAGIIGYTIDATFYNLKNTGNFTVKAGAKAGDVKLGGLLGSTLLSASIDQMVNTGNLSVEKSTVSSISLGGISAANIYSNKMTNCSNSGKLSVASETTTASIYLAGITSATVNAVEISDCTNSGALTVGDNITCSSYIQLNGIATTISTRDSNPNSTVTNLKNTGNLSVGAVTMTATSNSGRIYMGGITGTVNAGAFSQCNNEGDITIGAATLAKEFMIGGITGYINYTNAIVDQVISFTDCENKGDITLTPTKVAGSYVGGFCGQAWAEKTDETIKLTRVKNSGDITCGDGKWGTPYISGIWAHINNYAAVELDACENSGNISFSTQSSAPYLGGIVSHSTNKGSVVIKNCKNTGNISNSTVVGSTRMAGILSSRENIGSMSVESCTNLGNVTLAGEQTATGMSYAVGGVVGYSKNTKTIIKNCINGSATDSTKGVVTVGTAPGGIGLSGVAGLMNFDVEIEGCINYGHISQTGKGSGSSTNRAHIGGVMGNSIQGNAILRNCENYGTVEYGTVTPGNRCDIGGVVGRITKQGKMYSCKNGGTVIFGAKTSTEVAIGGVVGSPDTNCQLYNCENLATGVVWAKGTCSSNYDIGGVSGALAYDTCEAHYCANYGLVKQTATNNGQNYIGGVIGYSYRFGKITHCTNAGPIETVGSATNKRDYVGGITGYARHQGSASEISDCVNTYPLVFTGKAGTVRCGGLFGCTTNEAPTSKFIVKNVYNLADLTFKGNTTNPGAEQLCYGGIVGLGRTSYDNAQHYGDITAIGLQGYVGAIYGVARDVTSADTNAKCVNSKAGGNIIYSEATEEDANGETVTFGVKTPIDLTMFYSVAIAESVALEDGCSLLTSKPATPVYTYIPEE